MLNTLLNFCGADVYILNEVNQDERIRCFEEEGLEFVRLVEGEAEWQEGRCSVR
jgi:hypothetical protein